MHLLQSEINKHNHLYLPQRYPVFWSRQHIYFIRWEESQPYDHVEILRTLPIKLQKLLAEAQESPMKQSRVWMSVNRHPKRGSIEMYIRIGRRLPNEPVASVLTLASLTATPTGTGLFKEVLGVVEGFAEANGLNVYVENVMTERFANFWRGRAGYVEQDVGGVPNFRRSRGSVSS